MECDTVRLIIIIMTAQKNRRPLFNGKLQLQLQLRTNGTLEEYLPATTFGAPASSTAGLCPLLCISMRWFRDHLEIQTQIPKYYSERIDFWSLHFADWFLMHCCWKYSLNFTHWSLMNSSKVPPNKLCKPGNDDALAIIGDSMRYMAFCVRLIFLRRYLWIFRHQNSSSINYFNKVANRGGKKT